VKVCKRCGNAKPSSAFPRSRRMRDGLSSWCRVCHAGAVRQWREANPDRVEAYNAARREAYQRKRIA
jgi:hypothetical protein